MVKSRITTDKPEGVVRKCDESLHYFVLIDLDGNCLDLCFLLKVLKSLCNNPLRRLSWW